MKQLYKKDVEIFIIECVKEALKSSCLRSRCGSVIVKDRKIIGRGFNSPALGLESQRRCKNEKSIYDKKVTDKTCCVHAEERAIFDALKNNPQKIEGSVLFFVRTDENGNIKFAGQPYCTICSKIALDVGIKEFVLVHENGIASYEIEEYNDLSYQYNSN